MILLAKGAFPSHQRLEDLFSHSYSLPSTLAVPRQDDDYESAIDDDSEVEVRKKYNVFVDGIFDL